MIVSSNLTVPNLFLMQRSNKKLGDRKYDMNLIQRFKNEKCFFIIHITFSAHNLHVCVTNRKGQILMRDSAGTLGFLKGSRNTYVAFFEVGERIAWQFHRVGGKLAEIWLKGKHKFLRAVVRGLILHRHINVLFVRSITPISHNGCRVKRKKMLRRRRFRKILPKVTRFLSRGPRGYSRNK